MDLDPKELLFAVRNSNWEVVKHLIEGTKGAIFLRFTVRDKTIFHYVCEQGSLEMAEYLLDKEKTLIDIADKEDYLGFHYACKKGHYELVDFLHNKKQKHITKKDKDGWTGYHHACCNGHFKVATFLLTLEPDLLNQKTKRERTGFHYAAMSGNRELAEHLMGIPDQENAPDKDGKKPRDLAKDYGKREIVELLGNPMELHRNIKGAKKGRR